MYAMLAFLLLFFFLRGDSWSVKCFFRTSGKVLFMSPELTPCGPYANYIQTCTHTHIQNTDCLKLGADFDIYIRPVSLYRNLCGIFDYWQRPKLVFNVLLCIQNGQCRKAKEKTFSTILLILHTINGYTKEERFCTKRIKLFSAIFMFLLHVM